MSKQLFNIFIILLVWFNSSLFGQKLVITDITIEGWTDSGIDFVVGDKITILSYGFASTSGKVVPPIIERWGGPSGPSWVQASGLAPSDALVPNAPQQRLLGKIGTSGTAFAVGDAYASSVTSNGRLYLAFNDQKGSYTDNFGYFISFVFKNPSTSIMSNQYNNSEPNYSLSQNYPNPFNPETQINYQISNPGHVILKIYNSLGQEIRTILDQEQQAGFYTAHWDGRDIFGQLVSSGLYFYTLKAGEFTETKKALLIR